MALGRFLFFFFGLLYFIASGWVLTLTRDHDCPPQHRIDGVYGMPGGRITGAIIKEGRNCHEDHLPCLCCRELLVGIFGRR